MKATLGIDARIDDLRKELIDTINKSDMPASILDYVLTDILNEIRLLRDQEVQRERREYQEQLAKTDEQVKASLKGEKEGT